MKTTNYKDSAEDRDKARRELSACKAFTDFFLGYELPRQIEILEREIIDGFNIDEVPNKRIARHLLLGIIKQAEADMKAAINRTNQPL